MASDYYQDFIKEAFIDSIRSVLIIDDDYPTFDEVLGNQHDLNSGNQIDKEKNWYETPERIREVIRKFRSNNPPLLVDIHDGRNVAAEAENTIAGHLYQSDLLVLDYQLDKSRKGDGTRAVEILRYLMSNDHLNLVIVYTNEDLDTVFDSVRLGLIAPSKASLSEEEMETAEKLIYDADEKKADFYSHIYQSIDTEQYLHSRLNEQTYLGAMMKGGKLYSHFNKLTEDAGWKPEERKLVLRYILGQFEKSQLDVMNTISPEYAFRWSTNSTKWIKGESIFVCFSNKSDDDDLLSELQDALNDWQPNPSRLFLAKLRASMDEYGVVAQAQALTNKYALAYWYKRLLQTSESARDWYVAESVSRHSDQLMGMILQRVGDFAKNLIEAEAATGDIDRTCQARFDVDLTKEDNKKKAFREHNAYVCSRKPEGSHLTTGQIFTLYDEHWICLSPACDMVPSQMSPWKTNMFGERLPFIAVRLRPIKKKWPEDINTNRYLFFQVDDGVQIFCFNDPDPSKVSSLPHWNTFYAEDAGRFGDDFRFKVWRTEEEKDGEHGAGRRETNLVIKHHDVKVVSQLRDEYAINLMQKLGVSLTRVGLDFSGG